MEKEIKILEDKVSRARERIAQAEKQYAFSLAKLEHQKKACEETKQNINLVKQRIAMQLCQLQKLREVLKKREVEQNAI